MAGTKTVTPSPAHLAYREALIQAMRDHGQTLQAHELLAINAHMVGQLIAFQDQRTMTPDEAMRIVGQNIEQGNTEALAELMGAPGGTA